MPYIGTSKEQKKEIVQRVKKTFWQKREYDLGITFQGGERAQERMCRKPKEELEGYAAVSACKVGGQAKMKISITLVQRAGNR